jgi:hypothetical protein
LTIADSDWGLTIGLSIEGIADWIAGLMIGLMIGAHQSPSVPIDTGQSGNPPIIKSSILNPIPNPQSPIESSIFNPNRQSSVVNP